MHDVDRQAIRPPENAGTTSAPPQTIARRDPLAGDNFDAVDGVLESAITTGAALGVVAMAATPRGLVYSGSFGKANLDTGAPMREDTVFWLLSMTKAFTATAAMQLIEQGRIGIDQPAAEILPELASPNILDGFDAAGRPILRPAKREITVRHLLTHTSGYTYSYWSDAISRYEEVTGIPNIATCRNAALALPLEFEPGERWQYGISMDWVGKIIERVTGQSLDACFRENIFAPLGMKDSGFLLSDAQRARLATFGHRQADGSLMPAPFEIPQQPEFFMGGGGAFSTPRDYMIFLQMLLNGGSFNNERLLSPATVTQMTTNQIGELDVVKMVSVQQAYSNSFDQFPGQQHKWGISFDINTKRGPNGRAPGSVSWAGLLNSYFWLDPLHQVTGALFTQVLPFYDERIVALYGAFERELYRGIKSPGRF